jgi:hypothetical protein
LGPGIDKKGDAEDEQEDAFFHELGGIRIQGVVDMEINV